MNPIGVILSIIKSVLYLLNTSEASAVIEELISFWTLAGFPIITYFVIFIGLFVIYGLGGGIFFYSLLTWISDAVSSLGIYHSLIKGGNCLGETFRKKCWFVFKSYLVVALPLSLMVLFILNPSLEANINPHLNGVDLAVLATLSVIPGTLLSLRLLANPTKGLTTISFRKNVLENCLNPEDRRGKIRETKERYLSFYFSLIGATLVFLSFTIVYMILKSNGLRVDQYLLDYLPTMDPFVLIFLLAAEIIAILLTTVIGEGILLILGPLDTVGYEDQTS